MKRFLCLLAAATLAVTAAAQTPRPHPRLMPDPVVLTPESPSWALGADSIITAFSREVLTRPPVERIKTGKRLLSVSREALRRIFYLSYTYRVHGGDAYARRAIDEMLAVCAFEDWNPTHFLDVGEMAMAVAIGYDWLYPVLSPEERTTIGEAVLEKAFQAAENEEWAWFYTAKNNWNSVCNAGLIFAATALWDEYPDRCAEMLRRSLESNPVTLAASFQKDGGYPEGYNYWGYGVGCQILLFDALETAFGTDFGLMDSCREGFLRSAQFMQFMSTPTGHCYNFSDSAPQQKGQFMQAWMAWKTGDTSLLYPEIRFMEQTRFRSIAEIRLLPFFLIVASRLSGQEILPPEATTYTCGGRTPVFIYRSGWTSPDDTYLGLKGGLTQSSHSHCDQGSFVFESEGVRWAVDLGMQDYYSIEKLGLDLWDMTPDSERWDIFRIGPFSHNILTVNGHRPKVNHPATLEHTWHGEGRFGGELDLGEIYSEDLKACRREIWTDAKGELHVRDRIETGDSTCTVRWALCTEARPTCRENGVLLQGNGHEKQLKIKILNEKGRPMRLPKSGRGEDAGWTILPTTAPGPWLHDYDAPNPGTALVCHTVTLPPRTRVVLDVTLTD